MSETYQQRKRFFDQMLTVYGRKAVLEALQDASLEIYRLHLADSNKDADILRQLVQLAKARDIEVQYHSKQALSRISKNAKQDQGVAADLVCPVYRDLDSLKTRIRQANPCLLALDGVTNPQNVGMILRSAAAGGVDAVILPEKGCADIGPLVIKASAGTAFRMPLLRCRTLLELAPQLHEQGFRIATLAADARTSLFDFTPNSPMVYVLGNESEGVSAAVSRLCDTALSIPMQKGVESLNVAVTASLIAYRHLLASGKA